MRVFDWRSLLEQEHIPYVDKGANVKRGHLNIRCPSCGSADPSYHLGLDLTTGWWACWRNSSHRGKSPLRLIMLLLDVPYWRARQVAGLGEGYVDPEGFDATVARLVRGEGIREVSRSEFLELDKHFKPITDAPGTRRFWNYLYQRGFAFNDVDALCREYGLHAARDGRYSGRVILPYMLDQKLVAWTARAIADASIRYLDLFRDDCLVPIKETLYNHDCILDGGKVLVVQEGPFDALKIDFYGKNYGVRSVALSTNSLSEPQTYMLQAAASKFDRVLIMMDNATALGRIDSMRMKAELQFLPRLDAVPVPYGSKDSGALTPSQAMDWAEKQTKG